jgi:hypothetical protein
MISFVFIFIIVPVVVGRTIDIVRNRFGNKTIADKDVVSEVGDEPEVVDETRL